MEQKIEARDAFVLDKWKNFHLSNITKYTLEQLTAYVFVVAAMNFCFWPDNPAGQFEYEHMTRSLETVLVSEPGFFTPLRLATVTEQEIRKKVFNNNKKFALVDERARLVREVGQRLLDADKTFLSFV